MKKSTSIINPNQVQNGIIDVFKVMNVHQNNSKTYKRKGEISHILDSDTGKKIVCIDGALSASNFIEIPNPEVQKSLNYTGRNFYIQLSAYEEKKFSFQLTFTLNNIPVKFNFKYPLTEMKFNQTNAYIVDIPIDFNKALIYPKVESQGTCYSEWNIIKFAPADFINDFLSGEFKNFGSITPENLIFKSVIFYSSLKIKGVFISNHDFSTGLPKELCFTKVDKNNKQISNNIFDMNYIFKVSNNMLNDEKVESVENDLIKPEFTQLSIEDAKKTAMSKFDEKQAKLKNTLLQNHDAEIQSIEKRANKTKQDEKRAKSSNIADKVKDINNATMSKSISRGNSTNKNEDRKDFQSDQLRTQMIRTNEEVLDKRTAVKNIFKKQEEKRVALLPDPIMSLKFILGYSGKNYNKIKYSLSESNQNLLFPSGSMMINFDQDSLKQKFFIGHSKPITCYVTTADYNVMFTAQEGKNALIRVWKIDTTRCVSIFTTDYDKISTMSISKNSDMLATVGLEGYNRELIILWNITNIEKVKVIIRQASHFNISQIKFSPYDQTVLSSCGKENIKFWRIKNDHLGGKAVVLNQFARNSLFSCIDYDNPFIGETISKGRLYVGSNQGCIFQISCATMELDAVFKIHDTPILSLAVNDAFCVTGSEDGYLRVWPIDFSEFFIEAKHDSSIVSIDISFNAMDIICGTKNGSIGTLNIDSKQYKTILRSPPGKVFSMNVHPSGNYLFTVEENASVRVWDIENKNEAFHFSSPRDPPIVVAAPKVQNILACGFSSGTLKIFDLETTSVLYECRAFNSSISKLAFIQNSSILVSLSSAGHVSLHDATSEFIQIKIIKIDTPTIYTDLSVSIEDDIFATIGPESTCALVWNTTSYGIRNRIPIKNNLITRVNFITNKLLSIVLENEAVQVYSLISFEGKLVKEFSNLHSGQINTLNTSKNLKYLITGGDEGIIKILCSKMLYKNFSSYQQFIGHSTGIKSLIIIEHKSLLISVSENDGIFFWNFLGDLTFSESELINELDNLAVYNSNNKKFKEAIGTNNKTDNITKHLENTYSNSNQLNNDAFNSTVIRKQIKNNITTKSVKEVEKFVMLPIENENIDDNLSYTKGSFVPQKSDFLINKSLVNNSKEDLSSKLYFTPSFVPEKYGDLSKDENKKITKKYILGNSLNTRKNLIYNPYKRYFIFSINNKIIIEYLEENRFQIILEDALDEISCISISNDFKYIAAGCGIINKDKNAPIFIWETENFTLIKRLNFHFKGIQDIKFSSCNQYLISAGNNEEKSICVWSLSNFTVLDSKSVKYPIYDIKPERLISISEQLNKNGGASINKTKASTSLHFITASLEIISFWRYDVGGKLECYHLSIDDLIREKNEFITSIELTPYFEKIRTSFVLLGTSQGNILLIEKEKKILIRKYLVSQRPLLSIFFKLERIIITADNPVVYSWQIPYSRIDETSAFDFMKDTKEGCSIMFLDHNTRSLDFTVDGKEGLIGTENGGIFYTDLIESNNIKIVNSHLNAEINTVSNNNNNQMISTSNDGTIRAWTLDTYDQKFEFCYYDKKCDQIEIYNEESIAVVLFKEEKENNFYDSIGNIGGNILTDNSIMQKNSIDQTSNVINSSNITTFLRVYNINQLKSIGKIVLPEPGVYINHFKLIFNGKGIIATTYQDKVFVFAVQNWNPVSILYTEADCDYIPKNQQFRHIDTIDIDNNTSICSISFSNGSVIIVKIIKNLGKNGVETEVIDKFNIFEYHMSKSDDVNTAEMFKNLTKFKTNYLCHTKFSTNWESFLYSFHESLQFLFIRNFNTKEIFRRIPLNYFPFSISLSFDEKYMAIGTKEGAVLFITRLENNINTGYNLDIFNGHYSGIKSLSFTKEDTNLVSASNSEMIVWELNL